MKLPRAGILKMLKRGLYWVRGWRFILFDRFSSLFFQVAIGIRRKTPQIIERGAPLRARFTENLKPGLTYQVVVKTVSGSVASWPATGNVTTRPLPVLENIQTHMDSETKEVTIIWEPNADSYQDQYKVSCNSIFFVQKNFGF